MKELYSSPRSFFGPFRGSCRCRSLRGQWLFFQSGLHSGRFPSPIQITKKKKFHCAKRHCDYRNRWIISGQKCNPYFSQRYGKFQKKNSRKRRGYFKNTPPLPRRVGSTRNASWPVQVRKWVPVSLFRPDFIMFVVVDPI